MSARRNWRIPAILKVVGPPIGEVSRTRGEATPEERSERLSTLIREHIPQAEQAIRPLISAAVGDASYIAWGVYTKALGQTQDTSVAKRVTATSRQPLIIASLNDRSLRALQDQMGHPVGRNMLPPRAIELDAAEPDGVPIARLSEDLTTAIEALRPLNGGCPAQGKVLRRFYGAYVETVF